MTDKEIKRAEMIERSKEKSRLEAERQKSEYHFTECKERKEKSKYFDDAKDLVDHYKRKAELQIEDKLWWVIRDLFRASEGKSPFEYCTNAEYGFYACTWCRLILNKEDHFNYCPNCGLAINWEE